MEFFQNLMNLFVKKYKPNEVEQEIYSIVESMLEHASTECITAPLTTKYYIYNKKLHYYIMLTDYGIKITNHTFSYHHNLETKFSKILIDKVVEFIEIDRKNFENEVFKNEFEMLKKIKNKIQLNSTKIKVDSTFN
jgi:hypothetical protein